MMADCTFAIVSIWQGLDLGQLCNFIEAIAFQDATRIQPTSSRGGLSLNNARLIERSYRHQNPQ